MSIGSILKSIASGAKTGVGAVASSPGAVRDALASLDDDDEALSFGDFMAAFNRSKSARNAGTPVVVRTSKGRAAIPKGSGAEVLLSKRQRRTMRPIDEGETFAPPDIALQYGMRDLGEVKDALNRNIIDPFGDTVINPVTSQIPEPVRQAFKWTAHNGFIDPIGDIMGAADWAYDNGISRPISFVVLASELKADPQFMASLEGKSWVEQEKAVREAAWNASKDVSWGQAVSYAIIGGNNVSITDPEEMERVLNHPLFGTVSGSIDAAGRIYLDPVALGANKVKAVAAERRIKDTVAFANEVPTAVGTAAEKAVKADKFYNEIAKAKSPAEVRHRFYASRNLIGGADEAQAMFDAVHLAPTEQVAKETLNTYLRATLGNEEAVDMLRAQRADLADKAYALDNMRRMTRFVSNNEWATGNPLARYVHSAPAYAADYAQLVDDAANVAIADAQRAARTATIARQAVADGRGVPQVTLRNTIRTNITRSEYYQKSHLGRTLRVVADFNPHSQIALHEGDFDVHVDRLLKNLNEDQVVRDEWRSRAIGAWSPGQRAQVLDELEDHVIDSMAARYNTDPDLIRAARDRGRKEFDDAIKSAEYDTVTETTRVKLVDAGGDITYQQSPLHPTQFQNYKAMPDYRRLERIAKQNAGVWSKREQWTEVADDALNSFYQAWKPTVLFGTRTPIRVVGEEFVRFMSQFGAMNAMSATGRNVAAKVTDRIGEVDEATRAIPGVSRRPVNTLGLTDDIEGALESTLAQAQINTTAGIADLWAAQISARRQELVQSVDNWKSLSGTDPGHLEAWVNDVNNQITQAPLARKLLENGGDIDDAVAWLNTSDEGRVTLRANKTHAIDPEGWALKVNDQLNRYLPTTELWDKAALGKVTAADLENAFPVAASRPEVHGQLLDDALRDGHLRRTFRSYVDAWYENVAAKPSIVLSRQPFYDAAYRESVERQARRARELGITEWSPEDVQEVIKRARNSALGRTRDVLYDMHEYSRFAEATRFVAPFANATREVLTTWAGIAYHQPAFVRRMNVVWSAPERAGIVYDQDGNKVHPDGTATSPSGKTVKPGEGRYVILNPPDWADDIPVLGAVVPDAPVQINKDSLNTLLANPYGTSPVVQIAVARLVDDPQVEHSLRTFFPYGIDRSVWKPLLPSFLREILDDQRRATVAVQLFKQAAAEYEANGRQGDKPTMKDAKRRAWAISGLHALARITLPTTIREYSPVQMYADLFREEMDKDPENAVNNFLDRYGVEASAYVISLSENVTKIDATLDAWSKTREYSDLIEELPELGGVIVGPTTGSFNTPVFSKQVRRGDRVRKTDTQIEDSPGITAGYYEYNKIADAIEARRIALGLPSLEVKAAKELKELKAEAVEYIGSLYPEWKRERQQIDTGRMERRIDGMRKVVEELAGPERPDLQYLGYYLNWRDEIVDALSQRKARGKPSTLKAQANRDLLELWNEGVGVLTKESLGFASLWNRYLDLDMPGGE